MLILTFYRNKKNITKKHKDLTPETVEGSEEEEMTADAVEDSDEEEGKDIDKCVPLLSLWTFIDRLNRYDEEIVTSDDEEKDDDAEYEDEDEEEEDEDKDGNTDAEEKSEEEDEDEEEDKAGSDVEIVRTRYVLVSFYSYYDNLTYIYL